MSAVASNVGQVAKNALIAVDTVVRSTDGLTRITEFALSILAVFEHFFESIPEVIGNFSKALNVYLDLTAIISIVKRCSDWFLPDENGKMIWQKAWQGLVSTACLTAAQIISFVKFLATTLKAFSLGCALVPLNAISHIAYIGFASFDIWNNSNELKEVSETETKLVAAKEKWARRADETVENFKQLALAQKTNWENKIEAEYEKANEKDPAMLALAKEKLVQWKRFTEIQEEGEVKLLCNRKVVQLDARIANEQIKKTKTWVTIAYDICLIALMIFSTIALFIAPPLGIALATLSLGIATSGLEFSSFIMDIFMKAKPAAKVEDLIAPPTPAERAALAPAENP